MVEGGEGAPRRDQGLSGEFEQEVAGTGEQLAFVTQRSLEFSGPIPHGAVLKSIDDVVPGAAAEIVAEAHANMRSDRENETCFVKAITALDLRGQWMAYSLTLLFGAASFALFVLDIPAGGIAFAIASVTPLAKAFLERGTGPTRMSRRETDDDDDESI